MQITKVTKSVSYKLKRNIFRPQKAAERGKKMAVKIRLRRMGQKKAPFYRIIVADSRSPRDGRFIEEIGTYDPSTNPSTFKVNEELAKKWLANGAQPTEQVAKLFKVAGIEK
jgi:small subunit ribosomal protein S16